MESQARGLWNDNSHMEIPRQNFAERLQGGVFRRDHFIAGNIVDRGRDNPNPQAAAAAIRSDSVGQMQHAI